MKKFWKSGATTTQHSWATSLANVPRFSTKSLIYAFIVPLESLTISANDLIDVLMCLNPTVGIPQGLATSVFLCDIYHSYGGDSDELDGLMMRWVDDIILISQNHQQAQQFSKLGNYGQSVLARDKLETSWTSINGVNWVGLNIRPDSCGFLNISPRKQIMRPVKFYRGPKTHRLARLKYTINVIYNCVLSRYSAKIFLDPVLSCATVINQNIRSARIDLIRRLNQAHRAHIEALGPRATKLSKSNLNKMCVSLARLTSITLARRLTARLRQMSRSLGQL